MGPDHPQIEIYMESKHGNIYSAEGDTWNWTDHDWEAGVDYRAPTCASCHMSAAGDVPATHDVSSRLSWELESEYSKRTDNTANSLGFKISDGSTWQQKQSRMQTVCKQCHSTTWVENYYEQADIVVELYNEQYKEAKAIVTELYDEGLLTQTGFDEPIEFKVYEMWHHEGRRARMAAFMQAPDYVQWHGFYDLFQDRVEIEHMAEEIREADLAKKAGAERSMVFLATNGPETEIYLKWNISNPAGIKNYEIYWDTTSIPDSSARAPDTTTTNDYLVIKDLTPGTVYYFTIVAIDNEGNETSMAFSSAMPIESEAENHDDDSEDDDNSFLSTNNILLIIVILVLLFALIASLSRRNKTTDQTARIKEDEDLEFREESQKPKKGKRNTKKKSQKQDHK
jgi:uncharacterized protein YxeA